jgi:hypothetical protein
MSKKYTTVAIAYDFDGTLAKGNIQESSALYCLQTVKGHSVCWLRWLGQQTFA